MSGRQCAVLCLVLGLIGACSHPVASLAGAPAKVQQPVGTSPAAPAPLRVVFGSCNDLKRPPPPWGQITALSPSVWIWLGDNIYADTEDMTLLRRMYDELRAEPGYAALRARARVLGTWDDHDYGRNDAGSEYPMRVEAQQALLDFLEEPQDSPRRAQAGVYASYDLGAPPNVTRVILLDTRFHRDAPGPEADVLGAAQWSWLESRLRGSEAAVHLIGSSIQVLAEEHRFEKWANFPAARERLLHLVVASGARHPVFLSGDRHFAELSKLELGKTVVYDLTSSSLNRPWDHAPDEPNRYRVGDVFWRANFGFVEIDWRSDRKTMLLQVRDEQGVPQIEARVVLAPLGLGIRHE